MLFNSYQFVFVFLPICLCAYYVAGRLWGDAAAKFVAVVGSVFFYSWWSIANLPVLACSVLANYFAARVLLKWRGAGRRRCLSAFLVLGIIGNLLVIGYFKYSDFLISILNSALVLEISPINAILPLGISFFTFQKIALLLDVEGGAVDDIDFIDYLFFVLFFPQLLAGPIVHHKEIIPQLRTPGLARFHVPDLSVGLMIFIIGLFKKVAIADSLAPHADAFFVAAKSGVAFGWSDAWAGVLTYTFQLYFDFSGYSDMALGLGRMFGIRLPINFNSPLKAGNIIAFWQRWHITLGRLLTAYVYNPIVMQATRRRVAAGKSVLGGRELDFGAFAILVGVPTMVTMFLCGLWHGAGYQYLVFGLIHGLYLTTCNLWRLVLRWGGWEWQRSAVYKVAMVGVTFAAVVVSLAIFRAPDLETGLLIAGRMLDLTTLPGKPTTASPVILAVVACLFVVAWFAPNCQQIMRQHLIAGRDGKPSKFYRIDAWRGGVLEWRPSRRWAAAGAAFAMLALTMLSRPTQFLYFQF